MLLTQQATEIIYIIGGPPEKNDRISRYRKWSDMMNVYAHVPEPSSGRTNHDATKEEVR